MVVSVRVVELDEVVEASFRVGFATLLVEDLVGGRGCAGVCWLRPVDVRVGWGWDGGVVGEGCVGSRGKAAVPGVFVWSCDWECRGGERCGECCIVAFGGWEEDEWC